MTTYADKVLKEFREQFGTDTDFMRGNEIITHVETRILESFIRKALEEQEKDFSKACDITKSKNGEPIDQLNLIEFTGRK